MGRRSRLSGKAMARTLRATPSPTRIAIRLKPGASRRPSGG
jgi:hypothetical protein